MREPDPQPMSGFEMWTRRGAYRILRAMAAVTPQRQAKTVFWTSAALSVVEILQPGGATLPDTLSDLTALINVNAINDLVKKAAEDDTLSDEALAEEMRGYLPLDKLEALAAGQKDMLRILTEQREWQRQMLALQKADAEVGAQLLTGMAEMGVDLAAILNALAGVATREDIERLEEAIRVVLERVSRQEINQVNVNTGGVGHVTGDLHAAGDVNMGKTVQRDEVHGDVHYHFSSPHPPADSPFPLPTLDDQDGLTASQVYSSKLSTPDRQNLCALLAQLPDLDGIAGRKGFVGMTLPHLRGAIVFDGPARTFVTNILTIAEQNGYLPSDETYHCIGAILTYILTFPEVNETNKKFCASLIVQYKLVNNETYLAELQSQFGIDSVADSGLGSRTAPSQDRKSSPVQSDDLVEGIIKVLKHGPKEQPYQLRIDAVGGVIRRLIIEVDEI